MSPAALGNGTLPRRGPLPIPEGDDSCDPCLPRNYTLRCPRLRPHPLRSLFMLCKYCRIRVKSSFPGFPRKRKVDCFALAFLLLTGLAQPIAAVPRNACLEWFLLLVLPLFELKT